MAKNFEKLIFGGLHEKHTAISRLLLLTFLHGPHRKKIFLSSFVVPSVIVAVITKQLPLFFQLLITYQLLFYSFLFHGR
jgi:hypothetical protein